MRIRSIGPRDGAEWLRMRTALWPDEDARELQEGIDAFFDGRAEPRPALVAVFVEERPDGRLGGFLELAVREYAEGCTGPTPYVEGWYVDADGRGRGVGGALVRAAEAWARAQGFRELASDVLLENEASLQAHEALGFQEVERLVIFRKAL